MEAAAKEREQSRVGAGTSMGGGAAGVVEDDAAVKEENIRVGAGCGHPAPSPAREVHMQRGRGWPWWPVEWLSARWRWRAFERRRHGRHRRVES